jgi:RND family efflux transporter MFP subunit
MNDSTFEPASSRSKVIAGILGSIILVGAVVAATYMVRNKPKAKRRPPMAQTPVVDVRTLTLTNHVINIEAMGVVIPAREVSLQAEVSGRIISIHPNLEVGGIVKKGDELVQLDPRSYEAILLQQQAALASAQSNADLEEGQQTVAKADLELMQSIVEDVAVNADLALRKPQRQAAQAAVDSAQAAVDQATLNVERTRILAPWDAVVLNADAQVGGQATPGSVLAQLAATESAWVQVSLPVAQLRWIHVPNEQEDPASPVTVLGDNGSAIQGKVLRRLADLDTAARMARLLVSVDDPFGLNAAQNRPPLLLNDYVSVEIKGSELENVYTIPRSALRDGHNIWMMNADHRFHIQPVDVIWATEEHVVIADSIGADQQLIVSALAAPVEGMKLRTSEELRQQAAAKKAGAEPGMKEGNQDAK